MRSTPAPMSPPSSTHGFASTRAALGAALILGCVLTAPTARAAEPEVLRQLLERYGPAVVTVEALVRTEMQMGGQGQDEENEVDIVGAVVDPGGLIMVWNSRISSARVVEMMRVMGRDDGNFDIDLTPLSFDVRLSGTEEPVEAFLAASDPQLDLAFLQLAEPPAEPLAFFDVANGASGDLIGEEIYTVGRLSTSFAHAPFLGGGRVVGLLTKPRRSWIVSGDLQTYGLPVVTAEGQVAGVLSTVLSSVDAERSSRQQGGMAAMMGGGDGKTMGPIGIFLLPAESVARAVARSRERAQAMLEERGAAGSDGAEGETDGVAAEEEAPATAEAPAAGEGG